MPRPCPLLAFVFNCLQEGMILGMIPNSDTAMPGLRRSAAAFATAAPPLSIRSSKAHIKTTSYITLPPFAASSVFCSRSTGFQPVPLESAVRAAAPTLSGRNHRETFIMAQPAADGVRAVRHSLPQLEKRRLSTAVVFARCKECNCLGHPVQTAQTFIRWASICYDCRHS